MFAQIINKNRFFLLLLFLMFSGGYSYAQIANPSGNLEHADEHDIWAQTLQSSHYNEFWNYQFFLNDGLVVHITFSVANFGSLKAPVSGVQVSVNNLGGETYQLSREYNIDHLIQDKENYIFRNREGRELFFEGKLPHEHRIRINTSKDDITYNIDLNLHNIKKGLKWGDGMYTINREKVGIVTHIPYAEVSGFVEVNGKRKHVAGSAYMDHTFQNQTTTRLLHSGYRYVHHQDADNWDILYMLLPENSGERSTIGYRLMKRDGRLTMHGAANIDEITKRNVFGENVARIIDINLTNGETIRITRMEDREKFSVLGELGGLARAAARRFLGGEVIYFRGEATLLETGERSKRGQYSFFIVG